MLNDLSWKTLHARCRDSRLQLMYNCNITHNNTAVSAEELGMVAADGRTKANHQFKFRAIGAVTAQLHGSFVPCTIPEWNRLPAAAADAASVTPMDPKAHNFFLDVIFIICCCPVHLVMLASRSGR